jgi:hypothetical protein
VRRNFANQLIRFALRRFIIHHDVCAFLGKAQCDAPADSLCRASDKRDLPGQLSFRHASLPHPKTDTRLEASP